MEITIKTDSEKEFREVINFLKKKKNQPGVFMKNKIIFAIFFTVTIICFGFNNSKALDTNSYKYFPLNIGDRYVYKKTLIINNGIPVITHVVATIEKDTVIYSKRYYYYSGEDTYICFLRNKWIRTDSSTGNLYAYNIYSHQDSLYMVDSLGVGLNDYVRNSDYFSCSYYPWNYKCYRIENVDLFGINSTKKSMNSYYDFQGVYVTHEKKYVKNIGLFFYEYYEQDKNNHSYHVEYYELSGCTINGFVYGDTTITKIENITTVLPENYNLYQNYPNPFNPTTKIKFDIPKSSDVKLTIFNSTGEKIETLFNENFQSGSYETNFDGSKYPSGIYFYRLEANGFIISRKMILLK